MTRVPIKRQSDLKRSQWMPILFWLQDELSAKLIDYITNDTKPHAAAQLFLSVNIAYFVIHLAK